MGIKQKSRPAEPTVDGMRLAAALNAIFKDFVLVMLSGVMYAVLGVAFMTNDRFGFGLALPPRGTLVPQSIATGLAAGAGALGASLHGRVTETVTQLDVRDRDYDAELAHLEAIRLAAVLGAIGISTAAALLQILAWRYETDRLAAAGALAAAFVAVFLLTLTFSSPPRHLRQIGKAQARARADRLRVTTTSWGANDTGRWKAAGLGVVEILIVYLALCIATWAALPGTNAWQDPSAMRSLAIIMLVSWAPVLFIYVAWMLVGRAITMGLLFPAVVLFVVPVVGASAIVPLKLATSGGDLDKGLLAVLGAIYAAAWLVPAMVAALALHGQRRLRRSAVRTFVCWRLDRAARKAAAKGAPPGKWRTRYRQLSGLEEVPSEATVPERGRTDWHRAKGA